MSSEKKRVRLLFLHPTFTFGGAERTAVNILKGLDRDLFSVTLVTSRKLAPYFSCDTIERFIPLEEIGINVWYTGSALKDILRDSRKVARLLKETQPDIALGMMYYAATLLCLGKILALIRTKVIASPRGPLMSYLEMFHSAKVLDHWTVKMSFYILCRLSHHIIVASKGLGEECVTVFGVRRERITVINNGIDIGLVQKLSREETLLDIPEGSVVISTSGRLAPEKNFPFLFKAVAEVRKAYPVKVLIIGDGPERRGLERAAQEMGIQDDVYFLGFQGNPFKYFSRSILYVHTCLLEGFGNAIVEALACGLPVIAADCPFGPREIIDDGYNGRLVDMHDVGQLKDAITFFIRNPAERERFSMHALESVGRFGAETMVARYRETFMKVAALGH